MINRKSFVAADLNVSNQLIYTHSLNTQSIVPTLWDDTGKLYPISDLLSLGDEAGADKANKVTLSLPDTIPGTWVLLLEYMSTSESTSGKKAFELSEDNAPDESNRIVFGKAATPAANMTFTNLFALLLTKLGFLKTAQNLNDLVDKAAARSNLGVYSTTAMDLALLTYAELLQVASGKVLGVANTAVFKPSASYHPSTKKYTDDNLLYYGGMSSDFSITKIYGSTIFGSETTLIVCTGEYLGSTFVNIAHNYGSTKYYVEVIGSYPGITPAAITGLSATGVSFHIPGTVAFYFAFYRIP
jgi:hypothetical protein